MMYVCRNDASDNVIELAFSKKRVDDRKQWLLAMEPGKIQRACSDMIQHMDR